MRRDGGMGGRESEERKDNEGSEKVGKRVDKRVDKKLERGA